MVRFWRVNRLASDLAEGRVTEMDKLHYLVALAVISVLLTALYMFRPNGALIAAWVRLFAAPVILFGTVMCFFSNGGARGQHLLDRYVCLSLPLFVRTLVIGVLVYWAVLLGLRLTHVYGSLRTGEGARIFTVAWYGYSVILAIAFYVGLNRAIARIARKSAA